MITALLKEGKSYKTCKKCQYETTSIEDMTNHLKECGGMKK